MIQVTDVPVPTVLGLSVGRALASHESVAGLVRWLQEVDPDELQIVTELRSGVEPRSIMRPAEGWGAVSEQSLAPHLDAVLGRSHGARP